MLDWQLMLQCFLLFVGFILGFLVCIPIGVNKSDYSGSCLLYAEIKSVGIKTYTFTEDGSVSSCNYVIYAGVAALLLGCLMLLGSGFVLYKSLKESEQVGRSWIVSLILLGLTALMTFFMFVAACIVSVGYKTFCDSVEDAFKGQTCKQFEDTALWNKEKIPTFRSKLQLAEIASWLSVGIWLGLVILAVFRFRLSRQARQGKAPAVTKDRFDNPTEQEPPSNPI